MNRRRFLSVLAGTAAASTVSYFLPPVGGWHSDVIVNPFAKPDWYAWIDQWGNVAIGAGHPAPPFGIDLDGGLWPWEKSQSMENPFRNREFDRKWLAQPERLRRIQQQAFET